MLPSYVGASIRPMHEFGELSCLQCMGNGIEKHWRPERQPPRVRGMRTVEIHQVDVFADAPFEGNPAAVVPNATGLSDGDMQRIAREMNLSETAFVVEAPEVAAGTVRVRFFTPRREVPVCGHATLAVHAVRAVSVGLRGRTVQVSPGARWPVTWDATDPVRIRVAMDQGPVQFGRVLDAKSCRALQEALGIARTSMSPDLPVQIVSTGHAKVLVPVRTPAILWALHPDMEALTDLGQALGVPGFFVFSQVDGARHACEARMFAPGLGLPEDPVNGSGHGPLAAYAGRYGLPGMSRGPFHSRMGLAMERPGVVTAELIDAVARVSGQVVPVWSGVLRL